MSAVRAIALNTFREAIRDRVLYLILFFAVLVILGSEALAVLAVGAPERVVVDLGLAAIAFFGALIAVFLGLSVVSREIDRRTVYTVVSKPVSRASFVIGKTLGSIAVVALVVAGMAVVFLLFAGLRHGLWRGQFAQAIAMTLLEDLVVLAFAVLFSCFTTPILGTVFSVTVYLVGHLLAGLKMLAELPVVAGTAGRPLLRGLYYLLPNLERFNFRTAALYGDPITLTDLALATAYGLSYTAAVLALAVAIFSRRDFV